MTKVQDLIEFVDRAERNRKYPEGTAQSLRAAVRLYQQEINDEEAASLDLFEKNFEQITRSVFTKNASKFTASSLTTYKSRIQKVIAEFKKYNDPAKMSSWTPKVITRTKRSDSGSKRGSASSDVGEDDTEDIPVTGGAEMHRFDIVIRPGVKAHIRVPHDLTNLEAKKIKGLIDSLTVDQ